MLNQDHVVYGRRVVVVTYNHGDFVPVVIRGPHAVALDANIQRLGHALTSGGSNPRDFSSFGGPEHVVDGLAGVHEFLGVSSGNLHLARRAEFCRVPKRVVEVGDGFKMLGFEEVGPQDEEFVFAVLGFFFFHGCVAGHGVHVSGHCGGIVGVRAGHGKHFLCHGLNGFSGDSSTGWVVHTAGSVAVGFGNDGGLHGPPEKAEP